MEVAMVRGRFVTIEGPEGAGKTTLTELLLKELNTMGIKTIKSKEPGTAFSGELRKLILGGSAVPMAELFLFLADRAQHVVETVKPALEAGTWVILDRFSDSTIIYQAIAKQVVDVRTCEALCRLAEQGCQPDRTLLLKADFDVCQARLAARSDQKRVAQQGGTELERRIWLAYCELASQVDRVKSIDVTNTSPNQALSAALEKLDDLFPKKVD
jgi:dTMP kinase